MTQTAIVTPIFKAHIKTEIDLLLDNIAATSERGAIRRAVVVRTARNLSRCTKNCNLSVAYL